MVIKGQDVRFAVTIDVAYQVNQALGVLSVGLAAVGHVCAAYVHLCSEAVERIQPTQHLRVDRHAAVVSP
jgi:hypothetical protein